MRHSEKRCGLHTGFYGICFLSDFNNTLFLTGELKSVKEAVDGIDLEVCIYIVIHIVLELSRGTTWYWANLASSFL